jgi:serine/threonine protein kinase
MEDTHTIGRYEILDRILVEPGQDRVTTIYRGRDPETDTSAAIKTIHFSEGCRQEKVQETKDKLQREAALTKHLAHPGIMAIYETGEDGALTYVATELVEGENLETYCDKLSLLPLKTVLDIVAQTADVLHHTHENGLVHRNIKPANIMLLTDGTVKVAGFGIAKSVDDEQTPKKALLGTPNYMSPEQAMGLEIDGRSDIFSLGVVFFRLLTGELPFTGNTLKDLLYAIARSRHPSVSAIDPNIPSGVENIVDKALAKRVDKRYQSASQMSEDMRVLEKEI